jgi:hypothetical protein
MTNSKDFTFCVAGCLHFGALMRAWNSYTLWLQKILGKLVVKSLRKPVNCGYIEIV